MTSSEIKDIDSERHWKMLWNVQLGIRYHMHMQNHYGRFGKFVTAFTLILSTSAGATLINSNVEVAKFLAFTAAALQVLELVIDSKTKTTLHTNLRHRYIQLEAELATSDYLKKTEHALFKAKLASVEVEEPPVIFPLIDQCHNELINVHDLDNSRLQKINCLNRIKVWWFS
jgi:hypothetical protein